MVRINSKSWCNTKTKLMIKKVFLGLFLMAALWACEKEPQNQFNYFPMTTGNYCVYNTYEIDSAGSDRLISSNDTLRVIGDTLIKGKVYKKFWGKEYGFNTKMINRYYRENTMYVLDTNNDKLLSKVHRGDTLYYHDYGSGIGFSYGMMAYPPETITIDGVNYNEIIQRNHYVVSVNAASKSTSILKNYYALNIGAINRQYGYFSAFTKSGAYFEDRLVTYHIQ